MNNKFNHMKTSEQVNVSIARNLRFLRLSRGLTQEFIAAEIHVSRSSYCAIENGATTPSLYYVYSLSHYYQVSIDHLIEVDLAAHYSKLLGI